MDQENCTYTRWEWALRILAACHVAGVTPRQGGLSGLVTDMAQSQDAGKARANHGV